MGSLHPVKLEKTQMCVCTVSAQSEDSRNNSHKRVRVTESCSPPAQMELFFSEITEKPLIALS